MPDAETIAEATAAVAEAADAQVLEQTAEAIEAAEERVEAAEETAEQLALAAMHTELGREIQVVKKELAACQNNLVKQGTELETLRQQMSQPPASPVPETTQSSSTPPQSSEPLSPAPSAVTVEETKVTVMEPPKRPDANAAPIAPAPAKKRRVI